MKRIESLKLPTIQIKRVCREINATVLMGEPKIVLDSPLPELVNGLYFAGEHYEKEKHVLSETTIVAIAFCEFCFGEPTWNINKPTDN